MFFSCSFFTHFPLFLSLCLSEFLRVHVSLSHFKLSPFFAEEFSLLSPNWTLLVSFVADSHVEVLSLSSGVGTSSQSGSAGSVTTPTETPRSLILPGMHVVCLENNSSGEPGSLHISQGDIIEGKHIWFGLLLFYAWIVRHLQRKKCLKRNWSFVLW
jgi:hypothetical protein